MEKAPYLTKRCPYSVGGKGSRFVLGSECLFLCLVFGSLAQGTSVVYPQPKLIDAAGKGDNEEVVRLIVSGAKVNQREYNQGSTALMVAARQGHSSTFKHLLLVGADIKMVDNAGKTLLMYAVEGKNLGIVQHLIDSGENVNLATKNRETALHFAAKGGHSEIVKRLLMAGANIHARRGDGSDALMVAAEKGCLPVVKLLVKNGADVNFVAKDREKKSHATPLHQAVLSNNGAMVEYFVHQGARVETRLDFGGTPVETAARNGKLESMKVLLKHGAEAEGGVPERQDTPLYYAASNGHAEIVKILIEAGANPKRECGNGWTAMRNAALHGHVEVVRVLLANGVGANEPVQSRKTTALHLAMEGNFVAKPDHLFETVQILLDRGADVNAVDERGTPLMAACSSPRDREKLVRLLISKGANVNLISESGETALIRALKAPNPGLVRLLLENGAAIDVRTKDGETPISLAESIRDDETRDGILRMLRAACKQ